MDESIPAGLMAELKKAAEYAATRVRKAEVLKAACDEIDRLREKNARLYPGPDIGVDIVRAMREGRNNASLDAHIHGHVRSRGHDHPCSLPGS